jgi:hypothetical protein
VAFGAALVVSVGLNIFLYREWFRQRSEVTYNSHFHGELIEEAINRYSVQIGVSREEAMRGPLSSRNDHPGRRLTWRQNGMRRFETAQGVDGVQSGLLL